LFVLLFAVKHNDEKLV